MTSASHLASNRDGGVTARGLGKRFGELWALRDLDLDVPPGTVLGLLGHNGAGKTTAIRILTTLSLPTTGSASVAGIDVVHDPSKVRSLIGVAAQQATVDGLLSGPKNLEMFGRLYHLPANDSRRRAEELIQTLDLADAGDRLVKNYSGGMRRRLDLAAALIGSPSVLFLDEPTTGLDPRSRTDLWQILRDLVRDGTTLILTTQYLEEADRLADRVVVLDHGRNVASGSPEELKARIGGDRIDVTVGSEAELERAAGALEPFASGTLTTHTEPFLVTAPIKEGTRLIDVVRSLDAAGVEALDINHRHATLDDVFLTLTSRQQSLEEAVP
ncbi:MAG TPA: ATP-binding cassette domain-containing protein [Dehalococcoidia bacterium]|nr:ATP-binding cassette domain-containing protein [Dehalococcoidia bacterium]